MINCFYGRRADDGIEFKLELNGKEERIHVILREFPSHLQQISLECEIEETGVNSPLRVLGFVHFNEDKLRSPLIDFVSLNSIDDISEFSMIINITVIAKY